MKKIIYLIAFFAVNFAFAQDFSQNINSYLNNNRTQLGLEVQDVENFAISTQSYSKSMQLHNVYVTQQYQGIDIFNTSSSFAVKNSQVVNANLKFVQNVTEKVNTTNPVITAEAAISRAATSLGIQSPSNLSLLETISNQSFVFSNGSISLENIPVKLVFQRTQENTLKLAWDLSIYLLDASHYYNVRIDAVTGALLDTNDWVVSCDFGAPGHSNLDHNKAKNSILFSEEEAAISFNAAGGTQYRVFPMPVESPNHGSDELVADPADVVASPFGWHDTDGVAGAEFTTTRGNNVLAQEDMNGNNGTGAMPDGGAGLNFDFPFDFDNPPADMVDAATVNLFYWNNIMHDVYYQYGFDEESGNFQEFNYTGLGTGSDSVNADAQDGSGTNNANFATPPEGSNPRMQMFLWGPPAGNLLTINNGPLAGGYVAEEGNFGQPLTTTPITEDIVVVEDDNSGVSEDPYDACDPIINGSSINGKIAIIRRGECEFGFKSLAAQNEGAIAVIIVNNVPGGTIAMGGGVFGDQVTIPVVMVSMTDGDAIIAEINGGNTVNGSLALPAGTLPDLDGDVDNGIIAHEYGHGISNRLTGGSNNTSCLSNAEQMGEGWSDWVGLMLTMEPGDEAGDVRGIGTYASGQATDGNGIRPAPYSTDFAVNDFTYAATNDGNISQPHGIGFVWATMLWDLNWALIDEYGWDADVYNGTGGNNIAIQLVMDGMKLQACSPGFVDGRDAILEADELTNAGANRCLIWEVFANRGLGFSADQGSSFSRSDQTEAFDLPADCSLGINDNNFDKNFNIYPNPSKGIVNIQSKLDLGNAEISVYDINGRKVLNQNVDIQNVVSINTENLSTGIYVLQINGAQYTHTTKLIIE